MRRPGPSRCHTTRSFSFLPNLAQKTLENCEISLDKSIASISRVAASESQASGGGGGCSEATDRVTEIGAQPLPWCN